jgi:prolyl-tRNA synthetase
VNRIMASLIETSNDKDGIVWPSSIAPYRIIILALNMEDSKVKSLADEVYDTLTKAGCDVLFDDRNESAGVKFKDADLIGIPTKIIIGSKNAKRGVVEVKDRKTGKIEEMAPGDEVFCVRALSK